MRKLKEREGHFFNKLIGVETSKKITVFIVYYFNYCVPELPFSRVIPGMAMITSIK